MSKKFILIGSIIILIVTGCAPVSVEPVTTPIIETRTSEVGPISDTPTAPVNTPTQFPSPTEEPTQCQQTAEPTPTQSSDQIQQSIMDQFVNDPLYDQFIQENQIPEQAVTASYHEYLGVDGDSFAGATIKVDPNSLSEEQKALNIPQRDYLVFKTDDGWIEFKLLPVGLQLETFSKSAVEFILSKEYQQGLQDYLDTMKLEEKQVVTNLETRVVNGVKHLFILVSPDYSKLNENQKNNGLRYEPCSLFILDSMGYREIMIRDLAGSYIGTTASFGDKDSNSPSYQNKLKEFGLVSLSAAFSNRYMNENNNPDYWTNLVSKNGQNLKIKEMYYPIDVRSAFENFNGLQEDLIKETINHFKQRSRDILSYIVKYNMQGKTTIELANEVFHYDTYVGAEKMPLYSVYGKDWIAEAYIQLYNTAITEFDLIPGKDFKIIGINERFIENPAHKRTEAQTDYIIREVNRTKELIANNLGIPVEEVSFDIGIMYHLGEAHGKRNPTVSLEDLIPDNRQMFISHLQDISERTNSRIHFSEVDAIGNEIDIANAYAELVKIAYDSGVVDSFVFFHALAKNRLDPNEDYQNPLFGKDFGNSISYYSLIASIYSILTQ